MVVQHNLRAMNSNRMLGLTASVQSKSTEKLSSGYKINRAADDTAGLSISEKMRKQIRGLTQASLNAADGISAVQTAEGALNEVQDMLQRMNELAVKASNGTMSEDDRGYIQDEINQLVTEIDRVAETTKFNETYLLKGNGKILSVALKDAAGSDMALAAGSETTAAADAYTTYDISSLVDGVKDSITVNGKTYTYNTVDHVNNGEYSDFDALKEALAKDGITVEGTAAAAQFKMEESYLDFNLHVGADSSDKNQISVRINAMDAASLGLKTGSMVVEGEEMKTLLVNGGDDSNARAAIDTITKALQEVSTQRSAFGAVQNRLEHTIANLDNVVENTTAAESQIRDTDMATEMVKYSNNNILAQAGQAMLAQANQANQGVLSLLG